ncbi:hypothetical protein BJY04DRAFT_219030 [Aspergillus karnatakaensis]|uniref:uncharacterized protein n=1 Tax=Aspergillus karnatakaensis TaxID=1810916 RepID=UPI003CCE071C
MSQYGAIFAHIPPLPHITDDPHAGDSNVRRMMTLVKSTHDRYRAHFPTAATSIVCALFNGEVLLQDQVDIMRASLQEMGYSPSIRQYVVPIDTRRPGQGTAMARFRTGDRGPKMLVQDQPI